MLDVLLSVVDSCYHCACHII